MQYSAKLELWDQFQLTVLYHYHVVIVKPLANFENRLYCPGKLQFFTVTGLHFGGYRITSTLLVFNFEGFTMLHPY